MIKTPSSIFHFFFGHGKRCGSGNTTHATVLDAGLAKILWQHKTLVTCNGQLTRCEVYGVSYLGKIQCESEISSCYDILIKYIL